MKKIFLLMTIVCSLSTAFAEFSFDDVEYWVGSGENEAALVVDWHDQCLVWGYRWDGSATGEDMLKAICEADSRFYALAYYSGSGLGSALGGIGYDADDDGLYGVTDGTSTYDQSNMVDGYVATSGYDFDSWTSTDSGDNWFSGWYNGYWSYWVDDGSGWGYSGYGMSSRVLTDGCWDGWSWADFAQYGWGSAPENMQAAAVPVLPVLTLSSSAGGSIVSPGEGEFSYDYGDQVKLKAQANDSSFVFSHFEGSLWASFSPYSYTVRGDASIRAIFYSVLDVLYIDANIPEGQYENGTEEFPFNTISETIEVAAPGATIVIRSGTYTENLTLSGKSLTLTGFDVNDANNWGFPVIQGGGDGPVITVSGVNDPNTLLQGLVVTLGEGRIAGGLNCTESQLTLANCLIVGNRCGNTNGQGGGLRAYESQVNLIGCTLSNNYGGWDGATLYAGSNSVVTVTNSILWDNEPNEILSDATSEIVLQYSSLADDPNFVIPGYWEHALYPGTEVLPSHTYAAFVEGDYHLDPNSPAIDAGDPNSSCDWEPVPNGSRVNMGAYGNTSEATMTQE